MSPSEKNNYLCDISLKILYKGKQIIMDYDTE